MGAENAVGNISSPNSDSSSNSIPPVDIPTTQTVLLLHGVKQQYQLTDGYPVPDTRQDHELLVRSHTVGLNPIDWKAP